MGRERSHARPAGAKNNHLCLHSSHVLSSAVTSRFAPYSSPSHDPSLKSSPLTRVRAMSDITDRCTTLVTCGALVNRSSAEARELEAQTADFRSTAESDVFFFFLLLSVRVRPKLWSRKSASERLSFRLSLRTLSTRTLGRYRLPRKVTTPRT